MRRNTGVWVGQLCAVVCAINVCVADDDVSPKPAPSPQISATAAAATPAMASGATPVSSSSASATPQSPADGPRFSSEDKWQQAGYNLDELVYTVEITNHDSRILRCRTRIKASYQDNGKLSVISDMQTSTVFPDQQVQVGTWTGLDQSAGASYSVECKPL